MSILNDLTVKQFTVINTEGEKFTEIDTPSTIADLIRDSIAGHKLSGSIYSGGSRWDWRYGSPDDVTLEFTRAGEIVDEISIPRRAWEKFKLAAANNHTAPESYLAALLSRGVREGEDVVELVRWIFKNTHP